MCVLVKLLLCYAEVQEVTVRSTKVSTQICGKKALYIGPGFTTETVQYNVYRLLLMGLS